MGRTVQNIGFSGEFQAASIYIVEHAPPRRRATAGGVQYISAGLGVLAASLTSTIITNSLSDDAVASWGWRLAFVLGAVLCLFGVYLRTRAPETPVFEQIRQQGTVEDSPLRTMFRQHRWTFVIMGVLQVSQLLYYFWQVFLPTYASLVSGIRMSTALALSSVTLGIFVVLVPLAAMASDRWLGRRPLIVAQAAGFALLSYPMLHLLKDPDPTRYFLVSLVGSVLLALTAGCSVALYCELFPTRIRASGVGFSFNAFLPVFGGSAPLIATWTIGHGHPDVLTYYMIIVTGLAAVFLLLALPETRGVSLED